MSETLHLSTMDGLVDLITDLGGDAEAMLAEVGLSHIHTLGPADPVSHRSVLELINLAAKRLRRRDFGLLWGTRTNTVHMGPLGVAVVNASSRRAAMQMMADFMPTVSAVLQLSIAPHEKRGLEVVGLVNVMKRAPDLTLVMERNVVFLYEILRQLSAGRIAPREVWFAHEQKADDAAYMKAFGRLPVFQAPTNGLVVATVDLDGPVAGRQPEMFEMAARYLERETHARTAADGRLRKVSAMLARNFDYSLHDVASLLGVHERLLQRRLSAAGETFSMLKDRVRRQEAERMLARTNRALTEIALMLGFKDLAAFSRASRRWFGAPPSVVRKALVETPAENGAETRAQRTSSLLFARRMRTRPEGV